MGQAHASGRTALPTQLQIGDVEPFLQETGKRIEDYKSRVEKVAIKNDQEAESAGTFAREMAQTVESIERQRKEFTGPLNAHISLINARFKGVSNPLQSLVNMIKAKLIEYQNAKELKAREELAKEQKRLAKLQEQREARAVKNNKPLPPPPPAPVAMPVQRSYGTTQARKIWTFKVNDIAAIPVEYLEVNSAEVRRTLGSKKAEIEKGGQPIPGITFYQETNMAV